MAPAQDESKNKESREYLLGDNVSFEDGKAIWKKLTLIGATAIDKSDVRHDFPIIGSQEIHLLNWEYEIRFADEGFFESLLTDPGWLKQRPSTIIGRFKYVSRVWEMEAAPVFSKAVWENSRDDDGDDDDNELQEVKGELEHDEMELDNDEEESTEGRVEGKEGEAKTRSAPRRARHDIPRGAECLWLKGRLALNPYAKQGHRKWGYLPVKLRTIITGPRRTPMAKGAARVVEKVQMNAAYEKFLRPTGARDDPNDPTGRMWQPGTAVSDEDWTMFETLCAELDRMESNLPRYIPRNMFYEHP